MKHYHDGLKETPDADVLYGHMLLVDKGGNPVGERRFRQYPQSQLVNAMLKGCSIPHGGAMIRKSMYEAVGGYDETLSAKVDYDLFSRVVRVAKCRLIPFFTYAYRAHDVHLSSPSNDRSRDIELQNVANHVSRYSMKEIFPDLEDCPDSEANAIGGLRVAEEFLDRGGITQARAYAAESIRWLPVAEASAFADACAAYLYSLSRLAPQHYRRDAIRAVRAAPVRKLIQHAARSLLPQYGRRRTADQEA